MKQPNITTTDAYVKCLSVLQTHKKVMLSYSGGADSDTMLDLVLRVIKENNIDVELKVVFFDTGIEYEATKRHIKEIEQKYGITIERVMASCPVPLGCKKFGLPFLSKYASQMISRLQDHNFDFKLDGGGVMITLLKNTKTASLHSNFGATLTEALM